MVAQFMLTQSLEDMGLVQLLPEYYIPSYSEIYAMYSHRNQPPLIKAFIDTVQQVIGTPPCVGKIYLIMSKSKLLYQNSFKQYSFPKWRVYQ